jgi:hypothetical protein
MSGISFQFKGKNFIFDNITEEQVICINELIDFWEKHNLAANFRKSVQLPLNTPNPNIVLPRPEHKVDLEYSEKSLSWWGYMHSNGDIQVKRYFGPQDIVEARTSPFVHQIVGPFKAFGRADAETYVNEQLKDIV